MRGISEGLPHIHDGELDAFRRIMTDLREEEVQILFLAAFSTQPDRVPLLEVSNNDWICVPLVRGVTSSIPMARSSVDRGCLASRLRI